MQQDFLLFFLKLDFGVRVLQIIALVDFLERLLNGVAHFRQLDLRDNVETVIRHKRAKDARALGVLRRVAGVACGVVTGVASGVAVVPLVLSSLAAFFFFLLFLSLESATCCGSCGVLESVLAALGLCGLAFCGVALCGEDSGLVGDSPAVEELGGFDRASGWVSRADEPVMGATVTSPANPARSGPGRGHCCNRGSGIRHRGRPRFGRAADFRSAPDEIQVALKHAWFDAILHLEFHSRHSRGVGFGHGQLQRLQLLFGLFGYGLSG